MVFTLEIYTRCEPLERSAILFRKKKNNFERECCAPVHRAPIRVNPLDLMVIYTKMRLSVMDDDFCLQMFTNVCIN